MQPLLSAFLVSLGLAGIQDSYPTGVPLGSPAAPQPGLAVRSPQAPQSLPKVTLERINAGVPWPRGLAFVEGQLIVVARGRHRNYGGPAQDYEDHGGCLYSVDPSVSEPYVAGQVPSDRIVANQRVLAEPDPEQVRLFDRSMPPIENTLMNRPYCTLKYDPASRNVVFCAYAGVDMSEKPHFRKNATDAIYRYDFRTNAWGIVELHRDDVVPAGARSAVISNEYYPHHDVKKNPAPHGLLNGPNGCAVVGRWLYACGKDNHTLARYDLAPLRKDPKLAAPPGEKVLGEETAVRLAGEVKLIRTQGHSAVAAHGGWLYVGYRSSNIVLRFPIDGEGALKPPIVGELIAEFEPFDPGAERSADIWDLELNRKGELFVSCAREGRVWRLTPDPGRPFDGNDFRKDPPTPNKPYLDLPKITGVKGARISNLAFDEQDRLVFCATFKEAHTDRAGGIFRVVESADGK